MVAVCYFYINLMEILMLSITDKIEVLSNFPNQSHILERTGDDLMSPIQLFKRKYRLIQDDKKRFYVQSPETFYSPLRIVMQIIAISLLPLSLISTLFGFGLKFFSHQISPELAQKYSYPVLVNVRSSENFAGKLPSCPMTPNCVSSQEKSRWGKLYDVAPLKVPSYVDEPMNTLKILLQNINRPYFNAQNLHLEEEGENYLHYTYTVVIPSGSLKGTYIDDLDIYYDQEKRLFQIRSASRTGFRDATHMNFNRPGANKNRLEALRAEWTSYLRVLMEEAFKEEKTL